MSLKITHKNSTAAGTPPAAGDIDVGEIAINAADARLYTKDTDGAVQTFISKFEQSGSGAVARTVESKLQDVVSILDFIPAAQHAAIKAGTSTYDCATDIATALGSATTICLFFPPGSYKVNSTVTLNPTEKSIAGDRAVLDFSSISATPAITVAGTAASLNPYEQNFKILNNLEIIGPGKTNAGSIGILFESAAEQGQSHTLIESVNVHDFETGHEFRSNSYIITFLNSDVYRCDTCIYLPTGSPSYSNLGERITYISCTLFNSTLAVHNENSDGSFHLVACSLDYCTQQIKVTRGRVFCSVCHIEGKEYASSPFVVENNNGAFLQIQGGWVLATTTPTAEPFSIGAAGAVQLHDCFVNGMGSSLAWASGTGLLSTRNIASYSISNNPLLLRSQDNILADGGFEEASVFDAFITADTAAITSRTSGANINLTTSATEARSGSKSLKAAKTFGGGSLCGFCIGAPILDRKSNSTFRGYYKKPGSETGTMLLIRQFARVEIIDGQPVITKATTIGDLAVTFTSSAVDWTKFQTTEPLLKTPSWANYTLLTVNLNNFIGAGSVYFDDFEFFEI